MNSAPRSLETAIFSGAFAKRLSGVFAAVVAVLVVGHIGFGILWPEASQFAAFQFNMNNEGNWTTWYNSVLDLLVGLTAFAVAWLKHRQLRTRALRWEVVGWLLAGGVFVYLSMDDAAQLHDSYASILANLIYAVRIPIPLVQQLRYYMWIPVLGIPGIILLIALADFFRRDLWPVPAARWLVLAGVVLLLSNPTTEIVESKLILDKQPPSLEVLYQTDLASWRWLQVLTLIQETTEMSAMICFLGGFLLFGENLIRQDEASREAAHASPPLAVEASAETLAR
jgi:hypothetical protein